MTKKRIDEIKKGLADSCEALYFCYKQKFANVIIKSSDAFNFIRENIPYTSAGWKESFHILFLNRSNRVIDYSKISEGSMVMTVVGMKELALMCVLCQAQGIILVHNHPSGQEKPSDSDIELTNKVIKMLQLFDVQVLDHLIVRPNEEGRLARYTSLRDEGYVNDWK
jgi:DNA repair protein RadC